jgi:molecular chaperone GrpE
MMEIMKSDTDTLPPREDLEEHDEIEIIEVIGLDEDSPAPAAGDVPEGAGESPNEVVLDFDSESGSAEMLSDKPSGDLRDIPDSERLMRLKADFDNYKKRIEREREANKRHASAGLVTRLLPVLDNFERALARDVPAENENAFREGIEMIFRQLLEELREEGLTSVDSIGQPFDPNVHEAVATDARADLPAQTVLEELQRGYLMHNRLLRPSLVKVCVEAMEAEAVSGKDEE